MKGLAWIQNFEKFDDFSLQSFEFENLLDGFVRVAVKAIGVNRADILQRRGLYPAPKGVCANIVGLEIAGEVIDAGNSAWKVGDRVMTILAGGGYASHVQVHHSHLLQIPDHLSFIEGAAIPENFLTAFDALYCQCKLDRHQSVMIHAIGSGVGDAAAQILSVFGNSVIATSRSQNKVEEALRRGLSAFRIMDGCFPSDLPKVDCILDFVGGAYFQQNLQQLKKNGQLMIVGLLGGLSANINLGLVLSQNLTVRGSTLRSRSIQEKALLIQKFQNTLLPYFEQQILHPTIFQTLDWKDAPIAHQLMIANQNYGKIVLVL